MQEAQVYALAGPIVRRKHGYIPTTDPSYAGSAGICPRRTHRTQEARVYSHAGPIVRRKRERTCSISACSWLAIPACTLSRRARSRLCQSVSTARVASSSRRASAASSCKGVSVTISENVTVAGANRGRGEGIYPQRSPIAERASSCAPPLDPLYTPSRPPPDPLYTPGPAPARAPRRPAPRRERPRARPL
eukprot:1187499-Prorocentrum_minimum.AAC.2